MHPNAITALTERLGTIAKEMIYLFGPNHCKRVLEERAPITSGFTFTAQGHMEFDKVVEQLLVKDRWADKYSEKHLRDKLYEVLRSAATSGSTDPLPGSVAALVAEYEAFDKELIVCIPIVGVHMGMDELQLGDVRLVKMTDEAFARLKERCRSIVMQTAHNVATRHQMVDHMETEYLSKFKGRVCAEVRVVAEWRRAEEIALDSVRRIVDLLRVAVLFGNETTHKIVLGLQGETCDETRAVIGIQTDEENLHWIGTVVFYALQLTQAAVQQLTEQGLMTVVDLYQKAKRSEFENLIISAVHWLASAQAQFENSNALLNLVTCLETFLKPAKDDPITATIAEGVAILTATELEERKRIKTRIKQFYGMRSKLTHEGSGDIDDATLRELTVIARELTVRMIRRVNEFSKQDDLRNWIEDQRLGGGAASPPC